MKQTRIEIKSTKEETLDRVQDIIKSYNPEEDSLVVLKVSGSLESSSTHMASNMNSNHLVAFENASEVLFEQALKEVAQKNPLKAALIAAYILEQKNS